MSKWFEQELRRREKWARGLKPVAQKNSAPVTRRPASEQLLRTYVQWSDAFDTPAPTYRQLIRILRSFNGIDLLEVFARFGLLYQHRTSQGNPINLPAGLFPQEIADRIVRKHEGSPTVFYTRATILFAELLLLRFGTSKPTKVTKDDIPTFAKALLGSSELSEKHVSGGIKKENVEQSLGYFYSNYLLNKSYDLASRIGRHWAFLTKYSATVRNSNARDMMAAALGEQPELQAALVFGLIGHYLLNDEGIATMMKTPTEFLIPMSYFDKMPPEIAQAGKILLNTISGDSARFRASLRKDHAPLSAYQCRSIFDMPLYKVGQVLYPLDITMLIEQYSSGQYARTYQALRPSNQHKQFADQWGRLFEHHIAEQLKSAMPGAEGVRLFIEDIHGFSGVVTFPHSFIQFFC